MNTAKIYKDSEGVERTIHQMVKYEPEWAANRIQAGEDALNSLQQLKAEILPLLNVAKEEFADGKYNHGFYYLDQAMAKLSAV